MTMQGGAAIDVRGVSKFYHRGNEMVTALKDISFTIPAGELAAIIGPSGSGKTTLMHIIGGLLTPDKGEIRIDDVPFKKRSDKAMSNYRNTQVGFVFQNFSLIPHYSALENVTLPMLVANIHTNERRSRSEALLKSVGLGKRLHQRADKLSGGERQRVSIARALAMKPKIIIADEPTGSLDSARGNEIMAVLETLNYDHGITVILVTHDPLLAQRAPQQFHIQDGKLVPGVSRASR